MPVKPKPQRTKNRHRSLFEGITALQVLLRSPRSLGITEIGRELGISKSSAHDLVASLRQLGFVDRDDDTRRYSLSPAIFTFLGTFTNQFARSAAIDPALRRFAHEFDTTFYVSVLRRAHSYVVCAGGAYGGTVTIGYNCPWYASACGKVLVARSPEAVWEKLLPAADAPRVTEHTVLDHDRLRAELRQAARTGVAWNEQGSQLGFHSVAAPIPLVGRATDRAVAMVLTTGELAARDRRKLERQIRLVARKVGEAIAA